MSNQHFFTFNPNTTTSQSYTPIPPQQPPTASRSLTDLYYPSDAYASRYLIPASKSTTYSPFLANESAAAIPSSSINNYRYDDISAEGMYSAGAISRIRALAAQDVWPDVGVGVDAIYRSLALKRSSEALYRHNILETNYTNAQNDWLSMNYLPKRPRIEETSLLQTYPQRPGEKDCAHYMLTRTCKFGEACKFDHPLWAFGGGIPDRKEVPAEAYEGLPERPGEPDCPYYLKTQKCKFGFNCKFNHPKEKEVDSGLTGEPSALPERPSEPPCAFYLKTGVCKFGATCRFHHPKQAHAPVIDHGNENAELKPLSVMNDGTAGILKFNFLPTPSSVKNSKGLPIRQNELDCPFYMKTGSCKYGATCRFNHPDVIGETILLSPEVNFSMGVGNPAASALQSFNQLGSATTVYPQRPGEPECDYFMKTGVCKFVERCRYHHPVDRAAPLVKEQTTVKLTLAGYPRREGALSCPYYMKTSTCKYGSTCKFDHPTPAEVLAMAAAQANSTTNESKEQDVETNQPSLEEPA